MWVVTSRLRTPYMIMNIIINNYKLSSLQLLDDILDDPELFDTKVKSIHKAMKLVHFGFLLGHPLCYEFGLSKMIIEKFSELPEAWFCFAKYVVIFPEENQNLEMISLSISRNKVKGRLAKLIKTQCCTILKMRETNISNLLKRKINKITKDVNSAKQKLRHVWDVVIQSNLGEIESATKKAISSINRVDIEFKRLIREYPNNRFVTRPYSRFLQELCANYTEASDMQNKTRLLQRGIAINEDHNHQYGMMIFDKIPTKLKTAKFTATENTDLTLSTGELDIEDNITKECENNQALAHRIMNIRIPGTFNSILLRLMILIFVNIIPFIIMIIFIHVLASMLQRPIVYLRQIAAIRSRFAQIASFSFRIFFNIKGYIPEIEYRNADPQEPIGNTWDINEQMNYILGESTRLAQVLNEYQDIGPNDKYLSHVYNALFTSSIQYHYYTSLKNVTIYNMSFQGIIIDYVVQTTTALNLDINKTDILEASFVLNMVHNTRSVLSILRDEIQNFAYYFEDIETKANAIMIILRIIFLMLIILLSIFTLILEIYWIQKNKIAAYKCSMLLPKSCISQLSKGLRSIKKEGTSQGSSYNNEEINKQEENILKIFSSGGMSSTKYDDFILMIIAVGLILMMEIFVILVISDSALKVTGIFPSNAPHMINIGGAYSSKQAAIYYLDLFTVCDSPGEVKLYTMEEYASFVNESLVLSDDLYESLRYGDDKVVAPFGRFEQSVEASKDVIKCDDPTAYQSTFIEVSNCYNADLVFTSITPFVNYILSPFYRYGKSVDPKNPYVNNMWSTLIFPIFTSFFVPMMNGILPEIHFSISIVLNSLILEVFVLIILSIILEIAILIKIKQIETHIRDVLKLLLHPPSEFILHNSKIMKVLSGNFNGERGDSENRDENFYYNVVENLSEITVGIDQNGVVESMNKQCRKLFNINSHEEYENKLLKDLMCNFTGDVDYVLKYSNALNFEGYNNHSNNNNYNTNLNNSHNKVTGENTSTKGKVSYGADSIEKTAKLLTLNQNNEKSMYLVYGNICCGKLVITFRDITAANRYQTLIREERYKCDKMLSSILPPSLVPRVQAGETNISFAVQSATILFLDIVSFTPWCGSLPADKVMYTLNQMFKKLDSNVAQYPTMMKIKCIGDCYMAAGGVFSEMNQPAEHAKEVVNFGLDAIDRIRDINKELNENLQIRVGVNTGGPIVAGVLGIGKPTFEIIGPAINMAQQMEHHGIPMKVHISRNVYELVYGDSFEISERGNIEVKGRSVVTYIVNKRNHQYQ
ncbi:Adenylate and Guanylate cyclase catalytic domain containing protein [Tritrichomonas foetus]|uniref:Adenylate and Guanylate cyclase catalytic domain containing protein n=1 Tax=Tritrichomonas foetus TaxID=1144522 RepID=A0A1J4JVC1_9EUKA|nr:Adenylate and Guanylate cyclase catalytic domain containing protein [Tritrichomonas foetus]|eukprot:OHT03073.1 Adenylate and Guanylate cyclase catalytic domain containing protein [Tritrichomonas foetus]